MQQIPAHTHPALASDDTRRRASAPAQHRCRLRRATSLRAPTHPSVSDEPPGDRRRSAAASRTPTSSRTCASTSSSRCSGSSRARPEEPDHGDPFVAEIRIFPFNFAPKGWAFCDGQLLPLSQNTALFSLLGTTYGGDGKIATSRCRTCRGTRRCTPARGPGCRCTTSARPAARETVTLLESEIPSHSHAARVHRAADSTSRIPAGEQPATGIGVSACTSTGSPNANLDPKALAPAGGDQPHNNMQPYLTLNFCIALQGVFPPRT